MVHGIERFKEYLGKYTKQYIFIGGTACDIILGRLGEHVDSKNIKKHKNDVLRLAAYIEKDATVLTTGQVREDVEQFISVAEKDAFDMSTLGIREVTYRELLDTIKHCYLSSMQK